MADDVVILNDFSGLHQTRTQSGKQRTTITIKSEQLAHNLDPKVLGKQVADAIRDTLRSKLEQISAKASPYTIRKREQSAGRSAKVAAYLDERARIEGKPRKRGSGGARRYSGGRLGYMPPNQTDRQFHDSGRFIAGLAVGATPTGWTVNVPANRLNADTLGDAGLAFVWGRLRELVPEFGDMSRLMDDARVRGALLNSTKDMITKARLRGQQLRDQFVRQVISSGLRLIA